jgi:tRNA modification GTPase
LVGRDAAIVTDIAGTTRDVLSEPVTLGKVTLRLSDTAGLRQTADVVEQIGVERAKTALDEAELVLALFDSSSPPTVEDIDLLKTLTAMSKNGKNVLYILTKQDLVTSGEHIPFFTPEVNQFGLGYIPLSGKSGKSGWDADALTVPETLTAIVEQLFIDGNLDTGESAIVFNARQHASLVSACASLENALSALEGQLPYDICAEDLRAALTALGDLSGHVIREEVISEIFSKFCIGK